MTGEKSKEFFIVGYYVYYVDGNDNTQKVFHPAGRPYNTWQGGQAIGFYKTDVAGGYDININFVSVSVRKVIDKITIKGKPEKPIDWDSLSRKEKRNTAKMIFNRLQKEFYEIKRKYITPGEEEKKKPVQMKIFEAVPVG